MRRVIVAEVLVLTVVFLASAAFIFWRIPTERLDEARVSGRIVATDCANHGLVSYKFEVLGRSYRQTGTGIDCLAARPGQSVMVWIPSGRPEWGTLTSQQHGPHTAFWQVGAFILAFAVSVLFMVIRLLPRVFAGGRLRRGPWAIGNWPWPSN